MVTASRPPGGAHDWEKDLTALWPDASNTDDPARAVSPATARTSATIMSMGLSNSAPRSSGRISLRSIA